MNDPREKSRHDNPNTSGETHNIDYNNGFDMWVLMDNAHFAIARSRFLEIAQYDLTKEQAQVLFVLQLYGGSATQAQIADFTMRQHHSVSTLVNRMCKEGLVSKVKEPGSKGFRIFITEGGKEKYARVTKDSVKMIFSSLTPSERRNLASSLSKLHRTARKLLGLDYKPPFLR